MLKVLAFDASVSSLDIPENYSLREFGGSLNRLTVRCMMLHNQINWKDYFLRYRMATSTVAAATSPGRREPIAVRSARINNFVLGKNGSADDNNPKNLFNR